MYARLNKQKLNTILAALRYYQNGISLGGGVVPRTVEDIATDGDIEPLRGEQLDELCDELNTVGDPCTELLRDIAGTIDRTNPGGPKYEPMEDLHLSMAELRPRIEGALSDEGAPGALRELDGWEQASADAHALIASLRDLNDQATATQGIVLWEYIGTARELADSIDSLHEAVRADEQRAAAGPELNPIQAMIDRGEVPF